MYIIIELFASNVGLIYMIVTSHNQTYFISHVNIYCIRDLMMDINDTQKCHSRIIKKM